MAGDTHDEKVEYAKILFNSHQNESFSSSVGNTMEDAKEDAEKFKIYLGTLERIRPLQMRGVIPLIDMLKKHLLHDVYYEICNNNLDYDIGFFDHCLNVCKGHNINIDEYYEYTGRTNEAYPGGVTLLQRVAGCRKHFDIFKKLIDFGANVNMYEKERESHMCLNVLHCMVNKDEGDKNIEMVEYLLEKITESKGNIDAEPLNIPSLPYSLTALYFAVARGQVETSKLLIKYGANKENIPPQNQTPLSEEKYNEILEYEPETSRH